MKDRKLSPPEKWIVIGIPILLIIGTGIHFMYDIFGESPIAGLFAPVNESVWEHSKMVLWPMILWWWLYDCFRGRQYNINKKKWFTSAFLALLTSLIAIPMLYYFYTEAFGVELLWVDILILLLSVFLGQLMGLHVYRYGKGQNAGLAKALILGIVLLYILFTFYPPRLPLFRDSVSGGYGIHDTDSQLNSSIP